MYLKNIFKSLALLMLSTASLCACNDDDDFEEKYGNGSPLAENVMLLSGYDYEYNDDGLVTKITHVETDYDEQGNVINTRKQIAEITYPQYNRAVMVYTGDYLTTTYVFAFGENHFANRVIETDANGETYMNKYSYDKDGHLTKIDWPEEKLELEWTDGNLTRIKQDDYDAYAELTYGTGTDFAAYGMSPFLLDINLGPFMYDMGWWFERGFRYALYLGFFGKPCTNLPATITSHDNANPTPEKRRFVYYSNGSWSLVDNY